MNEDPAASFDDTPASRRWLHQALAGAALRAGLAVLGLAPVALLVAIEDGVRFELLQVAVGLHLYAACLFALERRGAAWPEVIARLSAGGLLGAVLGSFGGASLRFLGVPWRAWEDVVDVLEHVTLGELVVMGLIVTLVTQVLGAWFHVRARTDRALPQVVCGVVLTALGVLFFLAVEHHVDGEELLGCLAALASGALVPLLVAAGERRLVHARVDPQAPRAVPGEVRPIVAGSVLVVLTILSLFNGFTEALRPARWGRPYEARAVGALKTIDTSQTRFRDEDKDGDGRLEYAASTYELGAAGLLDAHLGAGVKEGYVFRVLRSTSTPELLWIAAADPLLPGRRGARRFITNQAGVVYYRHVEGGAPVPLDAETCRIPEGWTSVSK